MRTPEAEVALLLGRSVFGASDIQKVDAVLSKRSVDLAHVARILRSNKVVPTALENLVAVREGGELYGVLQESPEATADIERYRAVMSSQLCEVASTVSKEVAPPLAIKGASLFFLLPSYRNRFMRDLDFLVEDVRCMWKAGRALMNAGYVIDEEEGPWLQNFSLGPGVSMDAHLTLLSRTGHKVELHSRNMAIADIGMMESQLWQRALVVETPSGALRVPTPEDALLILLAHSSNHGYLTLKDLNDIHALMTHIDLDWNYIIEWACYNSLGPYLDFSLNALREYYSVEVTLPAGVSRRIRCPWYIEKAMSAVLGVNFPSRHEIRDALAVLAMYYAASKRSLLSGIYHYLRERWEGYRMARYDSWPEWLQNMIDKAERGPFFTPMPQPSLQVMLAPVSQDVCARWARGSFRLDSLPAQLSERELDARHLPDLDSLVVRTSVGEILITPCGLFLPTRRSVFYEEDLRELEDTCDMIVEISHVFSQEGHSKRQVDDSDRLRTTPAILT